MSDSSTAEGPCAAYAEEFHEESQTVVPDTKQSAQVEARKTKTKRDAASDSGYSSRTAATNGSRSTSGSGKIKKVLSKVSGVKKSTKEEPKVEKIPLQRTKSSKSTKRHSLRLETQIESKEDVTKAQMSGESLQRTSSARSQDPSPGLKRSVRPSPTAQQLPAQHTMQSRTTTSRPQSFHAGYPIQGYAVQYAPPLAMAGYTQQSSLHHPSVAYQPSYVTQVQMSPNRQATYNFPATLPPQQLAHMLPRYEQPYQAPYTQHREPPPMTRRYSMVGPEPVVNYPTIPRQPILHRTVEHGYPPVSYRNSGYSPAYVEERGYLEDEDAYYRSVRDRRAMPPPSAPAALRPPIRQASTTPGAFRGTNSVEAVGSGPSSSREQAIEAYEEEVKQSKRKPLEHRPAKPGSPRKYSSDNYREDYKPLVSRSSSSTNLPIKRTSIPRSPDESRKPRPQSFPAEIDKEESAEHYQNLRRGTREPDTLSAADVKKANKSTKSAKPKVSESSSRSSGSRKHSNPEKRPHSRQAISMSNNLSIDIQEGCTATFTQEKDGMKVILQQNAVSQAPVKPQESEETVMERKSSITRSRDVPADYEPTASARRSSANRREAIRTSFEDTNRTFRDRMKDIDDTVVETDDFSEPEQPKQRGEKYASSRPRLPKLTSESRQSSRSARSSKSSKSTSSRRHRPIEGSESL